MNARIIICTVQMLKRFLTYDVMKLYYRMYMDFVEWQAKDYSIDRIKDSIGKSVAQFDWADFLIFTLNVIAGVAIIGLPTIVGFAYGVSVDNVNIAWAGILANIPYFYIIQRTYNSFEYCVLHGKAGEPK